MDTHTHPENDQASVQGLRLGPGAVIQRGDLQAYTGGRWGPVTSEYIGAQIQSGCTTYWVRPGVTLLGATVRAISRMHTEELYLINTKGRWELADFWNDQFCSLSAEVAQQLLDYNLVERVPNYQKRYRLTAAGRTHVS